MNNSLLFLSIQIIRDSKKNITLVYCNPTFSSLSHLKSVDKFKYHPRVKIIKFKKNPNQMLLFESVWYREIQKEIKNLNMKKALEKKENPTKITQQNSNCLPIFLHRTINACLKDYQFPLDMKLVDVTGTHEKI